MGRQASSILSIMASISSLLFSGKNLKETAGSAIQVPHLNAAETKVMQPALVERMQLLLL
jgi:hypothetical protein